MAYFNITKTWLREKILQLSRAEVAMLEETDMDTRWDNRQTSIDSTISSLNNLRLKVAVAQDFIYDLIARLED